MKTMLAVILALLCIALMSLVPATEQDRATNEAEKSIKDLAEKVGEKPIYATADIVKLMTRCGETKRLDAAMLLVRCLVVSHDPGQSNEIQDKEAMLPAIGVMQRCFGESIAPLLFVEGIRTDLPWLRNRIAFAARKICSQGRIQEMEKLFSLEESKSQNAIEFRAALALDDIPLELDLPTKLEIQRIEEALERCKRKSK